MYPLMFLGRRTSRPFSSRPSKSIPRYEPRNFCKESAPILQITHRPSSCCSPLAAAWTVTELPSHGGMFGLIIDQATLMCSILTAGAGTVTAVMKLRYRESVPLPTVVLYRTVATEREGRKILIREILEYGRGAMYCEAEALFVAERQGRLWVGFVHDRLNQT